MTQLCPEVGISHPCPPPPGCQLFSSFSHEVNEGPSPMQFPEHCSVDEEGPQVPSFIGGAIVPWLLMEAESLSFGDPTAGWSPMLQWMATHP